MSNFPYPGLRPFKREETDIFFGRDELSNQLIERLGDTHFLAVVGLSGCGKSSLVRAGLLAGLERGLLPSAIRWRIAECTPSDRPFFRLANALIQDTALKKEYTAHFTDDISKAEIPSFLEAQLRRGPLSLKDILKDSPLPKNTNLLLVIDQFEELFRYYRQGKIDDSAKFVRLLLESSQHPAVYVVITMRSEFIGDCALFHRLPEAINQGLFLTPRLTRQQLHQAIEGPAKVFDAQIKPALTNLLLNEMSPNLDEKGDIPDKLPVLQHALMRMWRLAKARNPKQATLTLKDYEKIGQLSHALSQHVDMAYTELANLVVPAEPQKVAEILFRRLCERDPARRDTRSPVKLSEIAELAGLPSWQQIVPVIDVFRQAGRHFLIPLLDVDLKPDSIIDISHESLIQHWKRLGNWANDEAESANIYRRLEDSACLWEDKRAELLSGVELEIALNWRKSKRPTALWAKRYGKEEDKYFELAMRFFTESEKEQKRQEEEKIARRQREQQEKEITQQREWKLKQAQKQRAWAVITLIVMFGFAGWIFVERNYARQQEQIAISQKQKADIQKQKAELARFNSQLGNAAWLGRSDDYKNAGEVLKKIKESGKKIPDSRRSTYNLLNWFNKKLMGVDPSTYHDAGTRLFAVAVSHNGELLAAAGEDGTLVLWDAKNGKLLQHLKEHTGAIQAIAFHPNGDWLASAGDDKQIIIWSLTTWEPIKKWTVAESVRALAVSSDGKHLASGGKDNNITLWDAITGQVRDIFKGHENIISALDFSSNGDWLASASYDDTARVWNVKTRQARTLYGHTDNVAAVAFSHDNKWLATSSKDTTVRLWNVDSGKSERVLLGHKQAVFGVRFVGEDGHSLVSASDDITLRVWNWDWNSPYGITLRVLQGHSAGINGVAVHKGKIFSASEDETVKRWDSTSPYQQIVDLPGILSTTIAPNGNSVAIGFADGALRLYALPKPDLLWEKPTAHHKEIKRLAFNSAGTLLASASFDSTAKLWQVKDGKLKLQQTFSGHKDKINAITFSPDGHTVATASSDGQIGLFTVGTEQQRFYQAHQGKVKAVSFDQSGTQLLSTSNYEVRLWAINNNSQTLQEEYSKASNKLMWSTLSPDSQQIASVGRDQVVHIYSTTNKSTLYELTGHESTIYRVLFSPDGQHIATVSADATLRLWDLHEEGKELFSLRLPTNSRWPVPLRDFDFRCTEQGNCWLAVPLTRGKLMLYELGNIYKAALGTKEPVIEPVAENEQFIPLPSYRTGPYTAGGKAIFGGFMDYMEMLNKRDAGINGVKLVWEECETAYQVDLAIECYEQLKDKGSTGSAMFNFVNTGATYATMERAVKDKISLVSIGYGRSDTANGRVFPYVFPLLTTYWNQSTTKIKFIGEQEGGTDKLKGKVIANVYHLSGYGKETILVLEAQAEKYGFILKHFPIEHPGTEQKSTWEQIKRLNPDWIILRGWGVMNSTALKEAKRIGFKTDHIVGVWWSGSEEEVIPAGKAAIGFIAASFHLGGEDFKVIQYVRKYVYTKGKKEEQIIGSMNYNRGIIHGILNTEAIRTAQAKYGEKPLTGEEVRWGLEHLNLTEERIKQLGAEGLLSPIRTSCANHEGGGKVIFQQWDGEKWNIISNWIAPDYELTDPMVKESALRYAEENGITPRDCAKEQ